MDEEGRCFVENWVASKEEGEKWVLKEENLIQLVAAVNE
jgi:hypothetical protein